MTDTSLPLSEAMGHWLAAVDVASGAKLNAELIVQLTQGAALLLKFAKAHPSADARAAERWLSDVGLSLGLVSASMSAFGGMGAVWPPWRHGAGLPRALHALLSLCTLAWVVRVLINKRKPPRVLEPLRGR